MNELPRSLPLLPLLLADVPRGLQYALAQDGVPHAPLDPAIPSGRFVLYDSTRTQPPALLPGQSAIDIAPMRRSFANDPFEALLDERSARRGWRLADESTLLVTEEVARHDKRTTRRELLRGLQREIEARGGLWLRVAPFPFPHRTVFNFRLDHDEFVAADFDATLRAISGHEEAVTHFACGATHAPHPEALARLRGMDVGSHGYWHHTYHDAEQNHANIARGIDVLRKAGLEPSGFAAPHGRYPRGLAAALARLGIMHSSEFAFSYDDWPVWPAGSSVLQLPVHPVCLGSALEAARGRPELALAPADVAGLVAKHFQQVALAKHKAGEPILLYGHPDGRLGRHPAVLRETLDLAASLPGVWRTSLTNLAAWWKARSEIQCCVWADGAGFRIDAQHLPRQQRAAVELWHGERVATVPLSDTTTWFSPDTLAYETRQDDETPRCEPAPQNISLRRRLLHTIDWEHVTPTHEIAARTLPGWLKRSLRRVRDKVKS